MAYESIAPSTSWAIDSEPIRAREIIVNYSYSELLICFELTIIVNLEDCVPGLLVAEKISK